jgi:4'-phosphopantetheinyl transferase
VEAEEAENQTFDTAVLEEGNCFMSPVELLWPPAPDKPMLAESTVHVWCAPLDQEQANVEAFFRFLSPDEQERAGRFYFARDRQHFIVGRGVLRSILGRYLDLEPRACIFSYGSKGKPSLAPELVKGVPQAVDLRFNLSHSGGLALFAFTYGRDLGVDIEQRRELEDAERIARRFFSRGEVQVFCALPMSLRMQGFFNCWTRKEAYIKATGDGLSMPLDCFEVSLLPGEPARFLRVQGEPAAALRWFLRELQPASDYVAAVCVEGQGWTLQCWRWT